MVENKRHGDRAFTREPQPSFSLFTNLYHSLGNGFIKKRRLGLPCYCVTIMYPPEDHVGITSTCERADVEQEVVVRVSDLFLHEGFNEDGYHSVVTTRSLSIIVPSSTSRISPSS